MEISKTENQYIIFNLFSLKLYYNIPHVFKLIFVEFCHSLICYFDVIVTCEDTKLHKPHPEPCLETARRLNVQPEKCLVFED